MADQFVSKYTSTEIEAMLDKVKQDMQIITYTQAEIETLLGKIESSTIPTKVSDLTNDNGFITNTVNNLVNYYTKTETYTKTEIDNAISAISTGGFVTVSSLPSSDISTKNIYLVPSTDASVKNLYDEYINTDGTSNGWELIGTTKVDLTNYVDTTQLSNTLANYVTATALAGYNYVTNATLSATLSTYVTNNSLTSKLNNYVTSTSLINTLNTYYTKSEVDALLAGSSGGESEPETPTPEPEGE